VAADFTRTKLGRPIGFVSSDWSTTHGEKDVSIYETIGGERLVAHAVEQFYSRLKTDPFTAEFFEGSDVEEVTTHQTMFLTAALGGPDAYEGRDMRAAHAHLQITDADFDRFIDYLAETLDEVGAAPARITEVLAALEPLRVEIVHAPIEGSDEWGSLDPVGGSG
jgi:hemoglobin